MKWPHRALLMLFVGGCVTSSIDANRGLWQEYLKESQAAAARTPSPRATAAGAPKEPEPTREPLGLSILANEVLGREVPAQTETRSNRALFGYTPPPARRPLSPQADERRRAQALARKHVFGNYERIVTDDGTVIWRASDDGLVPRTLRKTAFVQKYTRVLVDREHEKQVEAEIRLSRGDIVDFGRKAFRVSSDQEESGKTSVGRMLRMYLSAYLKGKFVDRTGRLYTKPEIVHAVGGDKPVIEIGTDAIAGFAAVAIEALTDAAFGTPVLKKGDNYFTEGNRKPTFAEIFGVVENVKDDSKVEGITELEVHLIQYLSQLAGTKSRILADLVFGLLDEGEIEFVVGAHFAFGSNDTLRVLLDTLFDVSARKITSHLAYKGLSHFEYTVVDEKIEPYGSDDTRLGRVIALLLQEQDLLQKLLPPAPGP